MLKKPRLYFTNGALNILTDLLVAALPVKVIWDLKLPRKQKIALLTILTIGWLYDLLIPYSDALLLTSAQCLHRVYPPFTFAS